MRYEILVNPRLLLLQAPPDGVRAIAAHELAHVLYYKNNSRLRLLGMVRMLSFRWRSRFERDADREAIRRGFGPGLKAYRKWLYQNIPSDRVPEKMRDYLSPEEIDRAKSPSVPPRRFKSITELRSIRLKPDASWAWMPCWTEPCSAPAK